MTTLPRGLEACGVKRVGGASMQDKEDQQILHAGPNPYLIKIYRKLGLVLLFKSCFFYKGDRGTHPCGEISKDTNNCNLSFRKGVTNKENDMLKLIFIGNETDPEESNCLKFLLPNTKGMHFEVFIFNERRMMLDTCHHCNSLAKVPRLLDSWAVGHLALF